MKELPESRSSWPADKMSSFFQGNPDEAALNELQIFAKRLLEAVFIV